MNPIPTIVADVFTTDATNPVARLVHLALAAIANEQGHVETTVHTLEHMTGLLPSAIEIVLGYNHANIVFIPAGVSVIDGIVTAELVTGA